MAKITLSKWVLKKQNIFFCTLKPTSLSWFLPWRKQAFRAVFHWQSLLAKLSAVSHHDYATPTWLGFHGQHGRNRNNPICVASPKDDKASWGCISAACNQEHRHIYLCIYDYGTPTWLGFHGQHGRNRNNPICVASPKDDKASWGCISAACNHRA
jgi:hypothetical protein